MKNGKVLLSCAILGGVIWMSRMNYSAVATVIKEEFNLSYTQVGFPPMIALLFAALGYALSGFLILRYGSGKVLLTSALAMLASILGTASSVRFEALAIFQGFSGLSEGLFYVAALVVLTDAFDPSAIGQAIGILESSINLGILTSLTVGTVLAATAGWRAAYLVVAGLGFPALVLITIVSPSKDKKHEEIRLIDLITDGYVVSLLVPITIFILSFWSFWSFAPTYLVDVLQLPLRLAGAASGMPFVLAIFAAFSGGVLADRIGPRKSSLIVTVMYVPFLVLLATTSSVVLAVLSFSFIAFAQSALVPVTLTFIPKRFPGIELGRVYGVIISISCGVGAMGPILVGHVVDIYGFGAAFLAMAGVIALAEGVILWRL